jgi:hypothetical protein
LAFPAFVGDNKLTPVEVSNPATVIPAKPLAADLPILTVRPSQISATAPAAARSSLHPTAKALHAVNKLLRMAGGQCPLKGGQLTTTNCHGQLVNQLTGN